MRTPAAFPSRSTVVASFLTIFLALLARAPLAAQTLSVYPDGTTQTKAASSSGSVSFGISGLQANTTYYREYRCDAPVVSCSTTTGQSFNTGQATSMGINFTYTTGSTGGTGKIMLKVYKGGMTPIDTGWFNIVVDAVPPEVRLLAPTGTVGSDFPTIQVAFCDNVGVNTRTITVNGIDRTSSFAYGGTVPADCANGSSLTSSTVPFVMGNNTVTGSVCDNASLCTQQSWNIVRQPRGIAVRSELPQRQTFAGTTGSQRFFVKNLESGTASFTVGYDCTGGASGCSVSPSTISNLRVGESRAVTLTYSMAAGTIGTAMVKAYDVSFRDSAAVTLTPVNAPYPVVSVLDVNPGTSVQRDLCAVISTGAATAYECGDLRVVHPLPVIATMNRRRLPTLLYNSGLAEPYPIVAASVTLANSTTPDSVEAILTLNGVEKARGRWAGTDWSPGSTRRIALGYSAGSDTTKVYDYILEVATIYGVTRNPTQVTGKLVIVNRRGSGFGAGWWLAGLERLELMADGSKLWIGGDGSARLYTAATSSQWVAPSVNGPDTLKWDGTYYTRSASGGLKVKFNSSGQHVATINRLGHQTSFGYTGALLSTITLPAPGGGQVYNFSYDGNGKLATVSAPGSRTTTVTVTRGRVDAIRDPDNLSVSFTYADTTTRRLASRVDKRLTATSFDYDAAKKLSRVKTDLQPDSIRIGFVAIDNRGLVTASPKTAVDTAAAYTVFYGPRTYATRASDQATQQNWFYSDRFGAPRKLRDAGGYVTSLRREDGEWPALATEIVLPNGFTTRAGYDARGNLVRSIAINPFGDGRDTVTRYHWDPLWDAVDSIVTPMGMTRTIGYDATNGNRSWEQMGTDGSHRVDYRYGNSQGLLSSVVQQGVVVDSAIYDAQWNLAATRAANGYWTSHYKDALGRDTLVVTPIDSADRARGGIEDSTARRRDRFTYDVMDRDQVNQAIGPYATEKILVSKSYDASGNLRSLDRSSSPDRGRIGTSTTRWRYDRANRRVAEVPPDTSMFAPDTISADSTDYDPAGNVVATISRRTDPTSGTRLAITFTYDALNRMRTRVLPQVAYPSRPTHFAITTPWVVSAYAAYTIPAQTDSFTYDSVGQILTAHNPDAQVNRSYYPNGLLKTDSLRIQTWTHDDWEKHKYGIWNSYDFDGRRTTVGIPKQLGLGVDTTIAYGYDPQLGAIQTINDLQHDVFTFGYNAAGQLSSTDYPSSYRRTLFYDAEGRLSADTLRNLGSQTWPRVRTDRIRATRFYWDARDKLSMSADGNGIAVRDTVATSYTALGNVATATWIQHGCIYCADLPADSTQITQDQFVQDGLANHTLTATVSQTRSTQTFSAPGGGCCDTLAYQPGTGRLLNISPSYAPRRSYLYDKVGNEEFSWAMDSGKTSTERAAYYAADGSLRMVDSRMAANQVAVSTEPQQYTVEDYRYDALGRRVLVRARKHCDDYGLSYLAGAECRTSLVRRTVWDGQEELAEIQMPWQLQGVGIGKYDSTMTPQYWENDTARVSIDYITTGGGAGDPSPYFGHVVYAHGLGIDEPIAITRVNYVWAIDWYTRSYSSGSKPAYTVVPFWNSLGDAKLGVMNNGALTICNPPTGNTQCVGIQWPWDLSTTDRQGVLRRGSWHGSLLESKRDKSGYSYSRNRYYDPATGRFTQEDPIGLAGGLNAYGFAAGDPVNYSDPLGLKVCIIGEEDFVTSARASLSSTLNADIKYDDQGCVTSWTWKGDGPDSLRTRFAAVAGTRQKTYAVGYELGEVPGREGFDADKCERLPICFVGVRDFTPVSKALPIIGCHLLGGIRVESSLGESIAHELLGHAAGRELPGHDMSQDTAIRVENMWNTAVGAATRCQ